MPYHKFSGTAAGTNQSRNITVQQESSQLRMESIVNDKMKKNGKTINTKKFQNARCETVNLVTVARITPSVNEKIADTRALTHCLRHTLISKLKQGNT